MNYFVLTMQHNEDFMLPIFLDHYSRFLEPKHIKIIDHGSTAKMDPFLKNYDKIYIPRDRPFSEGARLRIIQHTVAGLLEYYDFGIFVDCDELIDLTNINEIDFTHHQIHYVAGFDVFFRDTPDGIRLRGLFSPGMSKPSIFSHMPYWTAGFHDCNAPINTLTFPMIHTRFLYGDQSKDRLNTRVNTYDNFESREKTNGVNVHWFEGSNNLNSFYEYINEKNCSDVKVFDRIDPIIYRDSPEPAYRFSGVEYDFTDRFPHIVNNYVSNR